MVHIWSGYPPNLQGTNPCTPPCSHDRLIWDKVHTDGCSLLAQSRTCHFSQNSALLDLLMILNFSCSYTEVYSVIYDSGSVLQRAIFFPRETLPVVVSQNPRAARTCGVQQLATFCPEHLWGAVGINCWQKVKFSSSSRTRPSCISLGFSIFSLLRAASTRGVEQLATGGAAAPLVAGRGGPSRWPGAGTTSQNHAPHRWHEQCTFSQLKLIA